MNSIERVQTILQGGIPDRVPIDLHNFLMAAQSSGLPFQEYLQNGEAMAEGQIRQWREFCYDMLLLENGTTALAEACGCGVEYLSDGAPVLIKPILGSLNDLEKMEIPDFTQIGRASCRERVYENV
jgi:uroporphyrinogen decarboxylase